MTDDRRIELEIEVPGTPEEVWRAIATGPGISSWYVPHTVEEREGGAASASFGPGPEMQVPGRVAAWEPPHRIVFDGGEGVGGFAFEWLVEARDQGSCVVRLVNSGFGTGDEWDGQYHGLAEGWPLFLLNLRLHLEHFRGQTATASVPTAMWAGSRDEVWASVTDALGIPAAPAPGIGSTSMPNARRTTAAYRSKAASRTSTSAGEAPFWGPKTTAAPSGPVRGLVTSDAAITSTPMPSPGMAAMR